MIENRNAEQLAPYEGRYEGAAIAAGGSTMTATIELTAEDGQLRARVENPDGTVADDGPSTLLAFYHDDYVVVVVGSPERSDFVRDPSGEVAWFRDGGRLLRKIA